MQQMYVLVVDDDEGIREIAVTALQDAGVDVVAVPDAERGLQVIRQRRPGLILLDSTRAQMSDAEFVKACRDLLGPHCPVILFSAWDQTEQHAAAIGADGVLAKPFELAAFVEQIRGYLSQP
ncbi:MAG TPA: response regulator [Chloroflexota bacterium]|jgi:CheY-like chemotaxis protein